MDLDKHTSKRASKKTDFTVDHMLGLAKARPNQCDGFRIGTLGIETHRETYAKVIGIQPRESYNKPPYGSCGSE